MRLQDLSRPDSRPTCSFYILHLVLLSAANIVALTCSARDSLMGLSIFGHGNNGTAHWEADPTNARGTFSILSTCIITLTLCVYTSLHLNVPAHKTKKLATIGMKVKYVITGLLAPESIVFNAWRQRTVAASIVNQIRKDHGGLARLSWWQRATKVFKKCGRKIQTGAVRSWGCLTRNKQEKPDHGAAGAVHRDPWAEMTLVHGFYIVMGGYVFDVSREPGLKVWPSDVQRLTPSAIAVLACLLSTDPDLRTVIPFLSMEEIWDKSKANSLAKAIVCVQAFWFCTQCIVRIAQGMPVSLLELNTFAHAICALLVYLLWWDKPLDVQEPTAIDAGSSGAARNICALAFSGVQAPVAHFKRVNSKFGGRKARLVNRLGGLIGTPTQGYLGDRLLTSPQQDPDAASESRACVEMCKVDRPLSLQHRPAHLDGLEPDEVRSRVWVSVNPPVFLLDGGESIPSTSLFVSSKWHSIDMDVVLLERLKSLERLSASLCYAAYEKAFSRLLDASDPDLCMLKPRELNFTDSLMRQTSEVSTVGHNLVGATGILLSGFMYGGLHLLAWGSDAFKSPLEDLAWKISCFVIAGGGLFTFAGVFGMDIAKKRAQQHRGLDVMKGLLYLATPIYLLFGLLYLVCRGFLLFEVFRNLAYLDPQVYETPNVSFQFFELCSAITPYPTLTLMTVVSLLSAYQLVTKHFRLYGLLTTILGTTSLSLELLALILRRCHTHKCDSELERVSSSNARA